MPEAFAVTPYTQREEADAYVRALNCEREIHADTPKALSGLWYLSETLLRTIGVLDTPIFNTLAYEYTLAREARDPSCREDLI